MVNKLTLTKELHDLREKAAALENKLGEEFKALMVEINAKKVALEAFLKREAVVRNPSAYSE